MNTKKNNVLAQFKELHKHPGTANYEVVEVIPKTNETDYFEIDTIAKQLFANSYFDPKTNKREDIYYKTLRLNLQGDVQDSIDTKHKLKNGVLWNRNYYLNWVVNGDTTKYKYLDPFTNKKIEEDVYSYEISEKDPKKWLQKFETLYAKATYVYIFDSDYFMNVKDKWYYMASYKMGEANNINLEEIYPRKEDYGVRIEALQNAMPSFDVRPEERPTDLIKEIAYGSAYEEEVDKGIYSYGYSAGWWYLEVYMPLGDTLKIKRYSDFQRPYLELYKIPSQHKGRADVLFIVQTPEELFPQQAGGMYVIRPRDPKQPERQYRAISYKTNEKGVSVIDQQRSVETEEYKAWKKKKNAEEEGY